ncbi:nitroreductase [Microvirga sp. W0021]|uniref:Putative NAD(P)H nitroreductase n=1 Tax=Hohaiivirga grylli TaxID=3133970 RepID=A0ABV0BKP2_9HYPH
MNDTLNLIKQRRSLSTKQLNAPGPDKQQLVEILTLASRVPDHGKLVPWRFVVIEGQARETLGNVMATAFKQSHPAADSEMLETEQQRFMKAPVIVALVARTMPHPKIPSWEQQLTVGAVAMNLLLVCEAAGFSGNWLTGWGAFDRRILNELGLKPIEKLAGFIHIGTPAVALAERSDRARPDMADIISYYGE